MAVSPADLALAFARCSALAASRRFHPEPLAPRSPLSYRYGRKTPCLMFDEEVEIATNIFERRRQVSGWAEVRGASKASRKMAGCPAIVDHDKLHVFPSASAMQHCEVEALIDSWPSWWPKAWSWSWKSQPRYCASGAPYHPTVRERLALGAVQQCDRLGPYRPRALSKDDTLADHYKVSGVLTPPCVREA